MNCRLCRQYSDTVMHMMSDCAGWPQNNISTDTTRYWQKYTTILQELRLSYRGKNWCQHQPSNVTVSANGTRTIVYDYSICTDRNMMAEYPESGLANRPDIVIRGEHHILDVSIPADTRVWWLKLKECGNQSNSQSHRSRVFVLLLQRIHQIAGGNFWRSLPRRNSKDSIILETRFVTGGSIKIKTESRRL